MTAEPTAAEKQLRRSVRRAVSADERVAEILTDNLAGMDAWVDAVLDVALPLVEARLREQIAGEAVAEIGRLRAAMAVARTVLQTLRWMIEEGGHDSIKLREGCLAIDAILRDALTPDTD